MQLRINSSALLNIRLFSNILQINHTNKRFVNVSQNKELSEEEIIIPKAIPRGPTDILKALASTVKRDYTGPNYIYLDDPYLTPMNNVSKKNFVHSKISGRKTAQYFIEKYPELFYRDNSEPKIDAFTYKEIYDKSMEFEELDLKKAIIRCDVSNSIICYEKLVKDKKSIEKETLYDLLDLVCYYNCEDEPQCFIEEEFFQKSFRKVPMTNSWKDNGFAEKLFEAIEPKTDRVYSSIIMGMAKYRQKVRAFAFYNQAIESKLKLNTDTYNAVINISFDLYNNNNERWQAIVDILKTMNENKIPPNIGTLNSILKQLSLYKFWAPNFEITKKVFNEFAFKFNITPSLATYYHLIHNFYRSKNPRSSIIYEIIKKIMNEKFTLQDPDDVYFFSWAMDIAYNLNDLQLAYNIYQIANNNYKFMGPNVAHNNYYNKFLKLLLTSESMEKFMLFYKKHVPNLHIPNVEFMKIFLQNIKNNKAFNYIPELYDQLCQFHYIIYNEIIHDLFCVMADIQKDDPLLAKFDEIANDLFEKINFQIQKHLESTYENKLQWTTKTLTKCLSIFNKNSNIEAGMKILKKMDNIKENLYDEPDAQALVDFCILAMTKQEYYCAIYCLKLCKDMGNHNAIDSFKTEYKNFTIDNEKIKSNFEQLFNLA